MRIRKIIVLAVFTFILTVGMANAVYAEELRVLFTHDIHSYLDSRETIINGKKHENGNIAKLSTLVKRQKNDRTIYVDGGDNAMGTLYQAVFTTQAAELRTLGAAGCDVVAFGNHEFDYGCDGLAANLRAAIKARNNGEHLPEYVEASFDFSGELTEEQKNLKAALDEYGCRDYVIKDIGGVKVAVFGIEGLDSIDCIQSELKFKNYIDTAKETVKAIGSRADVIICLSHSGTNGDGKTGEDVDLLTQVPEIDLVVSAHTHTAYDKPVKVGDSYIVSCGNYLRYLGQIDLTVGSSGIKLNDYKLIPINYTVEEDTEIRVMLDEIKEDIKDEYLEVYAPGSSFDDVLTHADFNFMTLEEMKTQHSENTLGNLIADSYIHEAEANGIRDIDVALVGLGTIRESIIEGDVKLSDAFEICSLGVGSDGSAGHPLLSAYITGRELKLLTELDASLAPMESSIKMSYSGLEMKFNTSRTLLDRVTDVHLVRDNGYIEEIKDDELYKVCCNMYAANMLGMLNGLTMGVLKIVPKDENGVPIEDFYSCALHDVNGNEIKEWVAFKNYLSLEKTIPERYREPEGRKVSYSENGAAAIEKPGTTTIMVSILMLSTIMALTIIILIFIDEHKNKKAIRKRQEESENEDV